MTEIAKKSRSSPEDRISALPDHLLHHILSSFELKEVMPTSLLSKRWRYLWTSVPNLDLGSWPLDTPSTIPTFITFFLLHYTGRKIKKFHAHFGYNDLTDYHINSWIIFVTERNVEEFDLRLDNVYDGEDIAVAELLHSRYKVLGRLLQCGSLEVLRLTSCELNPHSLNLRSLMELDLKNVLLDFDLNTSGCPVLESLILEDCNPLGHLSIHAPNKMLRYLKIHDTCSLIFYPHSALTIFAPHLQSIVIIGCFRGIYNVKNLSSLKSASLQVYGIEVNPASEITMPLVKLFQHVIRVQNLKLCDWCIKSLYNWQAKGVKFPPLIVTCLKLDILFTPTNLLAMSSVLRNAHSLESFTIKVHTCSTELPRERWAYIAELAYCLSTLQKLKTVEIHSFLGGGPSLISENSEPSLNIREFVNGCEKEIKLVKLILGSCMALERMNINVIKMPSWPMKQHFLLTLNRRLLALSSVSAELYISLET